MDIVPPDPNTQKTDQTSEKTKKIVRFSAPRAPVKGRERAKHPTRKRTDSLDLKTRLENYRAIFNTSPKGGKAEAQAVSRIAGLLHEIPDTDPTKHEYVRIAVDYHRGDDAAGAALTVKLLELSMHVENVEERLKTFHVLMRSKYCDDATKEVIAEQMLTLLEIV